MTPPPAIRILRGAPTPDELAALLTVLMSLADAPVPGPRPAAADWSRVHHSPTTPRLSWRSA
ncbi:acyl-CoA carboxylase subunit epsilon [Streptomyces sp. NPDC006367]|uniref:acyl-CoA carboxylase subunit epsilon n=1 Tax=unclassified Streptomyces TaxID=2593676 RepID=UPI0033A64A46